MGVDAGGFGAEHVTSAASALNDSYARKLSKFMSERAQERLQAIEDAKREKERLELQRALAEVDRESQAS